MLAPAVAGDVDISGAIAEGSDVAAGTVSVVVTLSGAILEGSDVAAGTIAVAVSVSGAITEGSDVAAGTIAVAISISGAVTEGSDAVDGAIEVVAADEVDISGDVLEGSDSVAGLIEFIAPVSNRGFGVYGVSFRRKNKELEVEIDEKVDRVELRRAIEEHMVEPVLSAEEIQLGISKRDMDAIIAAILASEL